MLKTGSMVLFIDNSGGGFRQLISKAAENCGLVHVFGPLNYENYTNEYFNVSFLDYPSCFSTTVTIHMWQKLKGNGNGANNIFPNKRIKSAACDSSNNLQVQNLNVPELSARQEPEIVPQTDNGELNPVRTDCLIENISTSIAQNGVPSEPRNNNTVFNSPLKANNGKQIITNNNTSATDNLSMQNGPLNMESMNNFSAVCDSASTDISSIQNELLSMDSKNSSSAINDSASTDISSIQNGLLCMDSKNSSSAIIDSASTDNLSMDSKNSSSAINDSASTDISSTQNGHLCMDSENSSSAINDSASTDNLSIQNELLSMDIKNSSTSIIDLTSTVEDDNRKP